MCCVFCKYGTFSSHKAHDPTLGPRRRIRRHRGEAPTQEELRCYLAVKHLKFIRFEKLSPEVHRDNFVVSGRQQSCPQTSSETTQLSPNVIRDNKVVSGGQQRQLCCLRTSSGTTKLSPNVIRDNFVVCGGQQRQHCCLPETTELSMLTSGDNELVSDVLRGQQSCLW